MTQCYLVVITRSKWSDYALVTDLPASFGPSEVDLKKRMKSFFPLDHADREIRYSNKLIQPNMHLQSWCGRIDSFELGGIPYSEQIGRPIKLGVGIVQELDNDCAYIRFDLAHVKSPLQPLIQKYQNDENYQPELIELGSLGIRGDVTLWKNLSSAGEARLKTADQPATSNRYDPVHESVLERDTPSRQRGTESSASSSQWLDDLVYLSKRSLEILDQLGHCSRCQESKLIQHFLSVDSRKKACLNSPSFRRDWKKVYKCLTDIWTPADIWGMPNRGLIGMKLFALQDCPGERYCDKYYIDSLGMRVDILVKLLDGKDSIEDIESRFETISKDFQDVLLKMLFRE